MPRWPQYPRRYRSPPFVQDDENGFQRRSRSFAPCDVRETVRLGCSIARAWPESILIILWTPASAIGHTT